MCVCNYLDPKDQNKLALDAKLNSKHDQIFKTVEQNGFWLI